MTEYSIGLGPSPPTIIDSSFFRNVFMFLVPEGRKCIPHTRTQVNEHWASFADNSALPLTAIPRPTFGIDHLDSGSEGNRCGKKIR
jgi:hypothetical protein